jgi:hypothetical protein
MYALIMSIIGLVTLTPSNTNVRSNNEYYRPSNTNVRSNNEYYRPSNTNVRSSTSSTDDHALMPSTMGLVILMYPPTLVALRYALMISTIGLVVLMTTL